MITIIMGHELKRDYQSTLTSFDLPPTPARLAILKMICEQFEQGFTLYDVLKASEETDLPYSKSTIVSTIGLFKIRGLVKRIEINVFTPDRKVGRPETKFICTLAPLGSGNDN